MTNLTGFSIYYFAAEENGFFFFFDLWENSMFSSFTGIINIACQLFFNSNGQG